jgi:hypothetical protein
MKHQNRKKFLFVAVVLVITALACSLPGEQPEQQPTATLASVDESLPEVPVEAELDVTIVHTVFPSEPAGAAAFASDPSSRALADERRSNADSFSVNIYERPFTAEVMDYQDYLDIVGGVFRTGNPFYYVSINLEGTPPDGSEARYGVEIDLDIDGRGDLFITGVVAPSTDWVTDGVRVYRDSNEDVGDFNVLRVDPFDPANDGYDELLFGSGQGDDPDLAWIRRSPGDDKVVQLAFKTELLRNDGQFLFSLWSDEGVREPAFLDYHDHFTLEEAGSPAINLDEYPLKALYSMDNTCRWAFGFEPNGTEPGVCFIEPTPTPKPPDDACSLSEFDCPEGTILWFNDDGSCYCLGPEG